MESIMKTRKSVYLSKLFRTSVLFGCFFSFGFSRSLAGPTMLELEKQVHGNANTFQIVFLLGAITFPLGNILAGFIMDKISPCLILFFATLILSFSNCSIPFSPNITVLATGTSFSEFALGLIDTGANVYCLQIW
ncbi:major facilitator superfamily domain-containing protein 4A-like [Tigriopus californicus]|uniref:major facilitator superfamily domain-containing protein 4A-like n=1 Tax=Tigriopus californicus TaxID=6832 RepID=UPI0027DAA1EF|nr:major facilitator superfamily domain-containing protein 4A-like [Tigriopus californicus]